MNSQSCFEGFPKIIGLDFQNGLLNSIGSTAVKLQYTVQYLTGHVESPCLAVLPVYTLRFNLTGLLQSITH